MPAAFSAGDRTRFDQTAASEIGPGKLGNESTDIA
jgi:hypothetical protein